MAATISFFLNQNVSGAVNVLTGTWAGIVNNSTSTAYKSTSASDSNGKVTINSVPAGVYTVYTSPDGVSTPPGGSWTSTGNVGFTVNETDGSNDTTVPGRLVLTTAAGKIVPGATSISLRNNADSADNLKITDAGLVTTRNAVEVPPSSGASLPSHSYATVPVKLDDQSGASNANTTLTVPSGGLYRTLVIHFTGRSDNAAAQSVTMQFNADTGANYDFQFASDSNATLSGTAPSVASTSGKGATLSASGAPAGSVSNFEIIIQNADSTTLQKVWKFHGGRWDADAAANAVMEWGHGKWRNTSNAITSIKLIPAANNLVNWRAVLYGWP